MSEGAATDEAERWAQRLHRERAARKQAEQLLEAKSLELYQANQALKELASSLEQQVIVRTAELRQAVVKAEAATRARSDFLAMMSHEIRTPLNGIIGVLQVLEPTPLSDEQRSFVEIMRTSGEALLVLINDILDFSKIEAGKLTLEERPFDLRRELALTLALYRPVAEKKGLFLRQAGLEQLPQLVVGDHVRLRQIISNLLSNALKFTGEGGVTLAARTLEAPAGQARFELEIQDTGIGIPEDKRALLFQAFSQIDASISRRYGGTGLGLAICARLCKAMNGTLEVQSKEGEGSRFIVGLCLPVPLAPPARASVDTTGLSVEGLRVLVVDDNPVNRLLARALLGRLGVEAHVVSSAREAIERVRQGGLDAVLMDLQMPEMDGIEAVGAIRALGLREVPPIIALTASAFDSDREQCLAAGMVDFISKPFQLADLREKLARLKVAGPG